MINTKTWNVNRSDGSFLGQSDAFAAQIAFIKCMAAGGTKVDEHELDIEDLSDREARVTYNAENFLLTQLNA